MTQRLHTNNASTTLNGAITNSATSITVTSALSFPTITEGETTFSVTLTDGSNVEIVEVTAVSGEVLTVTRGQEGTLGFAFADLDTVALRPTADSFDRKADTQYSYSGITTGRTTGGALSINSGDAATYDLTAGTALIVDFSTDLSNPTVTAVSWDAVVAGAVTDIATQETTQLYIDSTGVIQQQEDLLTSLERRSKADLGIMNHSNNTTISNLTDGDYYSFGSGMTLSDLATAIGKINKSGNVFSANAGADLTIDRTSGEIFSIGINTIDNADDVNHATQTSGHCCIYNILNARWIWWTYINLICC